MAVDHAADKIRVNAICPAFVETELTEGFLGQAADPAAVRRERTAAHPIGRLGRPEDMAGIAVYLVSDESSWVTGAIMPVDGGYLVV
jgi:NAD(P)-dependent dehydrogenase (short-subunit alcohol dehydrogenase family)